MVNLARMHSIKQAAETHNMQIVNTVHGNFLHESGGPALQEILGSNTRPTAIMATNDMMALGAIDEARHVLNLGIPNDLAITGIDGINAARFSSYNLTTIRQPIGRMADAATSMLADRVENPTLSDEKRIFTGALIIGSSSTSA